MKHSGRAKVFEGVMTIQLNSFAMMAEEFNWIVLKRAGSHCYYKVI